MIVAADVDDDDDDGINDYYYLYISSSILLKLSVIHCILPAHYVLGEVYQYTKSFIISCLIMACKSVIVSSCIYKKSW